MAPTLDIQADFLQETTHKLLDILQLSALGRIALLIYDAVLESAKVLGVPWFPCRLWLSIQRNINPLQGFEGIYSHLIPNSLAVRAVNDRA